MKRLVRARVGLGDDGRVEVEELAEGEELAPRLVILDMGGDELEEHVLRGEVGMQGKADAGVHLPEMSAHLQEPLVHLGAEEVPPLAGLELPDAIHLLVVGEELTELRLGAHPAIEIGDDVVEHGQDGVAEQLEELQILIRDVVTRLEMGGRPGGSRGGLGHDVGLRSMFAKGLPANRSIDGPGRRSEALLSSVVSGRTLLLAPRLCSGMSVAQGLLSQLGTFPFSRRPGVVAVYVFGSVAAGTAGAESDVDVAVLYATPPPSTLDADPRRLEGELERVLERPCRSP